MIDLKHSNCPGTETTRWLDAGVGSWTDAIGDRDMSNGPADPFSEACGLPGPLTVELEGPGLAGRSTLEFRQPFLVVGRDELADLTIDDPEVSPRHAFLQVIAGRLFCLNIGSKSGILWDEGPRLASWVDGGNGIRIGPVRIRFGGLEVGRGGSIPISEDFEWPSPTEARLEFIGDDFSRKPWPITRALSLLGSSPTCRIHLPGSGVGRVHAALVRTPTGIWIVDLLGPGGISVQGTPTRQVLLEDGDEILIGPHRMRFLTGPMPERPEPISEVPEHTELARRSPEPLTQPAVRVSEPLPSPIPTFIAERDEATVIREDLPASLDAVSVNKLIEEFDRMHQQTVDQFQQAIVMMFRMHQEHVDSVKVELARLDRLEEEQKLIRAELARNSAAQTQRSGLRRDIGEASHAPPRPRNRIADEAPPIVGETINRVFPSAPTTSPRPAAVADPAGSEPPVASRNGHHSDQVATQPLASDPDPHARLARRIAEIQDERQGLWKRIMASLSGDTSEMRLP